MLDKCSMVQPAPKFAPSTPSTRALALVSLNGSTDFVVRDVTDIAHPFTISTLGNQVYDNVLEVPQFVSAAEISTAIPSIGLVRMPLSGSPKTVVAACGSERFAWSPGGTDAAYMHRNANPIFQDLHLMSAGYDRVTDSTPEHAFGIACENRASCAGWHYRLLYSPGGAYISYVEWLPVMTVFRIWTSDGKVVKSMDGSSATMSVWSGEALYWRDDKGVERWRNGSQSLLLPGVSWIEPRASGAGGLIVYETRDAGSDAARVYVLDTATGKAREIARSRSSPAFLTSRYIWYRGERPCASTDVCVDPTIATGTTYLYDLQTGAESESIITAVFDVWPHPA